MDNYQNHVSVVCAGGCLSPWPCAKVSNEDQEGGLVVCTLDINTEVLLTLNYAILRKMHSEKSSQIFSLFGIQHSYNYLL